MLMCPKCRGERTKAEPAKAMAPGQLEKYCEAEARPCDECGGQGIIRDPQLDAMIQSFTAVVADLKNVTQWLNTLMGFFAHQHGWSLTQDPTGRATMRQGTPTKPVRPPQSR